MQADVVVVAGMDDIGAIAIWYDSRRFFILTFRSGDTTIAITTTTTITTTWYRHHFRYICDMIIIEDIIL